jgi:hypothetical protein
MTQVTYFSCVFSGKKIITHGEPKTWKWKINACESKVQFLYSGVVVTRIFPVEIGLHVSKVCKLHIFPLFSQEKRYLHMVNQKHAYGKLMPVSQGLIFIEWCGSITCFACQDLASQLNFTNCLFFLCFLRKKDTYTWWTKSTYTSNWCLWVKVWFAYSDVVVSVHVLPVKICFHTSKFHKLPIFPVFSQEKKYLHMVNQKTCIWQIDAC